LVDSGVIRIAIVDESLAAGEHSDSHNADHIENGVPNG
jgi:hypothetical protein